MKVDLSAYSTDLNSASQARQIYDDLKVALKTEEEVEIELKGIFNLTTNCATIIFGYTYVDLGAEQFYRRIAISGADDDTRLIIQQGIKNAVSQST